MKWPKYEPEKSDIKAMHDYLIRFRAKIKGEADNLEEHYLAAASAWFSTGDLEKEIQEKCIAKWGAEELLPFLISPVRATLGRFEVYGTFPELMPGDEITWFQIVDYVPV